MHSTSSCHPAVFLPSTVPNLLPRQPMENVYRWLRCDSHAHFVNWTCYSWMCWFSSSAAAVFSPKICAIRTMCILFFLSFLFFSLTSQIERSTHALGLRPTDIRTSFLRLFVRRIQGTKQSKPRTIIIYTMKHEDEIIDSENCLNVREWCVCATVCVNGVSVRQCAWMVCLCDSVREWCVCATARVLTKHTEWSVTPASTNSPFTHIHTTLTNTIDDLVFALRCVVNLCSSFVVFCPLYTSE